MSTLRWQGQLPVSHGHKYCMKWGTHQYVTDSMYGLSLTNIINIYFLKINSYHFENIFGHCSDVIMTTMASQITRPTIVYSIVYWDADKRKHQSSASLAFVWGIHRGPVNSPHKGPVTRKMFPFDDVIMKHEIMSAFSIILQRWDGADCQLIEAEWRIYASITQPSMVQIMACRLVGTKPLSEPKLGYC